MTKRRIIEFVIATIAILLTSFFIYVDSYASEFNSMDVTFWCDTEAWDSFSLEIKNDYVVSKYLNDIQSWYGIPESERLQPEDVTEYNNTKNKRYNKAYAFCLYPYDDHIYINKSKFSVSTDYMPGDIHAIAVLAHEICHIVQMREGRVNTSEETMRLQDIEASTNALNYLYHLTGNVYTLNNLKPVSSVWVHTY